MKKVIWSIVLSWVCLAFAAGIGTRDAVSACDGKVYKKGIRLCLVSLRFPDICLLGRLQGWEDIYDAERKSG